MMKHWESIIWLVLFFGIIGCSNRSTPKEKVENSIVEIPAEAIYPLRDDRDLDILMEEIGDAQLVLLGEASHGTSEFYTWRSRLSKRLIHEKGFTLIGIEGDWSDALPLNDYIKGNSEYKSVEAALENFDRWPQWMWANEEIADLGRWLRDRNEGISAEEQVSFYGLDVYGIWESLQEVHSYLLKRDLKAAESSEAVINCFAPFDKDEGAYARATLDDEANCEDVISEMLEVLENSLGNLNALTEAEFNVLQHAYVVANAETYYRTAVRSSASSWNVRDLHMAGTLNRLLEYHGDAAKIIIWQHNTHIGDARATDMADDGMINIGQLSRESYGKDNVYLIGFGTYTGEVIAAESWGSPAKVMKTPPAQKNSWEWMLHSHSPFDKIILMEPLKSKPEFLERIGHRAIGVVYDPKRERGNYVPSVLPERYDAFIFIDRSHALDPLDLN